MADVATADEEPKQEETTASVLSETDETSQETPNGVKTWVTAVLCSSLQELLTTWAKMEASGANYC